MSDEAIETDEMPRTEDEWRQKLAPEQFHILREKGTERAFTGKYHDTKSEGTYVCAGCGQPLYRSDAKFDSGSGWPSFFQAVAAGAIKTETDNSLGMARTELMCSRCDSHLGHVFPDGPAPTGLRHCINSAALELKKKD